MSGQKGKLKNFEWRGDARGLNSLRKTDWGNCFVFNGSVEIVAVFFYSPLFTQFKFKLCSIAKFCVAAIVSEWNLKSNFIKVSI